MSVSYKFPKNILKSKLYNRNKANKEVINSHRVKKMISDISETEQTSYKTQYDKAKKIFFEIANDMNLNIIRIYAYVLRKFIWKWMFEKIEVRNFSNVHSLAENDYQIIYVPNHRSHIDYFMMLDAIGKNGLMPPVMASGNNLNFFPAGYFLRKGCAFFVRRKFNGDKLYTSVLKEYVHYIIKENIPLSFFPEGGRSRSGKLLNPKLGFFSFVVESFLRDSNKKIAFVPAYISYDKVVESRSYEKENKGSGKKKESFFGFLSFFKKIEKLEGGAYLSFGEPLILKDWLTENMSIDSLMHSEKTLNIIESEKPQWYFDLIDSLGQEINIRINQSAVLNVASVVSFALAHAEGLKLREQLLQNFVNKMISIRKISDAFSNVSFPTTKTPDLHKALGKVLSLKKNLQSSMQESLHEISISKQKISNIIYSKNNIFHLFAMEAFIARLISRYNEIDIKSILHYGADMYPKIKKDFFLPWNQSQLHDVLTRTLEGMIKEGLLKKNKDTYSVSDADSDNHTYLQILSDSFSKMFPAFQP